MLKINPLLAIDAYKFGHMSMHPENIDYIYCNLTPRSMKYFNRSIPTEFIDNKLVAFGMQMAIQDIVQSTDTGKKSACGLLHVTPELTLIDNATRAQEATGALQVIFSNGSTNFETDFAAIRERAGL